MIDLDELERRRAAAEGTPWMSPEWLRYTATLRFNAEELIAMARTLERVRATLKQQASMLPLLPTSPPGSYARGYDSGMRDTVIAIDAAMQEQKR